MALGKLAQLCLKIVGVNHCIGTTDPLGFLTAEFTNEGLLHRIEMRPHECCPATQSIDNQLPAWPLNPTKPPKVRLLLKWRWLIATALHFVIRRQYCQPTRKRINATRSILTKVDHDRLIPRSTSVNSAGKRIIVFWLGSALMRSSVVSVRRLIAPGVLARI